MILYQDPKKINDDYFNSIHKPAGYKNKISIPIASAITAYARIFMSQFKNKEENIFRLYYTDTDSLHISIFDKKKFDVMFPGIIGSRIGQFKIEVEFKKVVYVAPKVYAGITKDGKKKNCL